MDLIGRKINLIIFIFMTVVALGTPDAYAKPPIAKDRLFISDPIDWTGVSSWGRGECKVLNISDNVLFINIKVIPVNAFVHAESEGNVAPGLAKTVSSDNPAGGNGGYCVVEYFGRSEDILGSMCAQYRNLSGVPGPYVSVACVPLREVDRTERPQP